MINKIKNRIELELPRYLKNLDRTYSLSKISPLLFNSIKDFASRDGKRVRPILFLIGYLGFSKKTAQNLYSSALSLELLHDFMLVHDDIIDKSETRRGKPSMHAALNKYLNKYKNIKFNGQDLAIVVGDVMYAMALDAFLSVKEDLRNKENAFKKLIEAALFTGSGEFIELLLGAKNIEKVTKEEIYKIYDLKTANYTFASPLAIGATLAGANKAEVDILYRYGTFLGRAFQIKDDMLGIFGDERKIGKSTLSDLQEAKKTILIRYAYKNSDKNERLSVKKILAKGKINRNDLTKIRGIITKSGSLIYAQKEIDRLIQQSQIFIRRSKIHPKFKVYLINYSKKLLEV